MNESFFKSLRRGFGLVNSSFGFIRTQKMSFVYLIIIIFAILWFVGGSVAATSARDAIIGWIESSLTSADIFPSWLNTFISGLAGFLVMVLSITIFGMLGGTVVLCAMSPIFSIVTEKCYSSLTGQRNKSGVRQLFVSIGRGIGVSLYNVFWQFLLLIAFFLLSFVPIVGLVSPFGVLLVNSYFFGSSMTDYSMELHQMKLTDSVTFARNNKGLMTGIGLPFALAVCLPWIGTYVALFVSPAVAVAGARAMVLARSNLLAKA